MEAIGTATTLADGTALAPEEKAKWLLGADFSTRLNSFFGSDFNFALILQKIYIIQVKANFFQPDNICVWSDFYLV